jgi:Muskelin N-terminus
MAWGANFNFSIWFIELKGIMNADIVSRAQTEYEQVRPLHPTF